MERTISAGPQQKSCIGDASNPNVKPVSLVDIFQECVVISPLWFVTHWLNKLLLSLTADGECVAAAAAGARDSRRAD